MEERDSVTWLLFGVITVSLGIVLLPSFITSYVEDWCLCGLFGFTANLGLMVSCVALVLRQITKAREPSAVDWTVPLSLGVILLSTVVLTFSWLFWTVTESNLGPIWFALPGGVALLGYLVLAVRLEKGNPRPKIYGLPLFVFLAGLGVELLLFWFLTPIDWMALLLSMGVGILVAAGCIAGLERLGLFGPETGKHRALVFFLIVSLAGLIGVAFGRPASVP